MQREVDTNKSLYDALLQRYKEVGVAGGVGENNMSIVDTALRPGAPFTPQSVKNVMLGGLGGLTIGPMPAFLLDRLDVSLKVPEDVERRLGLPLLGAIPRLPGDLSIEDAIADRGPLFPTPRVRRGSSGQTRS